MSATDLRIAFIGPLVGRNPGRVTTQGEKLADLFSAAGYPIVAASSSPNRYIRLADIVSTIVRRRSEIDVMIVFTYGQASFVVEDVASALGRSFGIPVVLALCGGALPSFIDDYPSWTRRVFRRAAALVCQSEYIARVMRGLGYHPHVIPNLIDAAAYTYRARTFVTPRLFWMRAFEDLYNPKMALRVLARVKADYPDATLVMAGQDTGLQGAIERSARDMGIAASVRFAGFLDGVGKQREGDAADIFINTPRIDNRPICVVEAGAMGLPIVSTNVGGIPDLLEAGVTGLLVDDDDDDAMARAVVRLVRDRELAASFSVNGRELAQSSSSALVRPAWESLLNATARRQELH